MNKIFIIPLLMISYLSFSQREYDIGIQYDFVGYNSIHVEYRSDFMFPEDDPAYLVIGNFFQTYRNFSAIDYTYDYNWFSNTRIVRRQFVKGHTNILKAGFSITHERIPIFVSNVNVCFGYAFSNIQRADYMEYQESPDSDWIENNDIPSGNFIETNRLFLVPGAEYKFSIEIPILDRVYLSSFAGLNILFARRIRDSKTVDPHNEFANDYLWEINANFDAGFGIRYMFDKKE